MGTGWDNVAYLVGGKIVFRFPQREVAVELLVNETAVLPEIADILPLAVPRPEWIGEPTADYAWPFTGYRHLPGTSADRRRLDAGQRARAAAPLGRFLSALHAISGEVVANAPDDMFDRLSIEKRATELRERLEAAQTRGLIADASRWDRVVENLPADWAPAARCLVHGDLYARHLLVDAAGSLSGVIDWGDVHASDPLIDLAVVCEFLPPEAHGEFFGVYGAVPADRWRVARFRSLYHVTSTLLYAGEVCDTELIRECRVGLDHIARGAAT